LTREECEQRLEECDRQLQDITRIMLAGDVAKHISKCTGWLGICYHEAGHAIMGCLLGRLPVSIEFRFIDARRVRGTVYWSEPDARFRKEPTASDEEKISAFARAREALADEGEPPLSVEELRAEVERVLCAHWDAAQAVALALEERCYMIRPEFCDIIRDVEPELLKNLPHYTMRFAEPGFPEFLPGLPQSSTPEPASPRETTHG